MPEKKGSCDGFFGFAAMFLPLFGLFVGGYLTDNFSWQWVFIMNIIYKYYVVWNIITYTHD